ncbi:MAG: hypothetical protein JNN32_11265 [Flavobacteriales bacterium]|nr:hypothetical protein [Flavobacteriales bacterium]
MPIHLYSEENRVSIKELHVEEWDLPTQLEKLQVWVLANSSSLNNGPYVADIGFMVRDDAGGGGAVLSHEAMRVFAKVNLSIYFSEYVGKDE